LQEKLRYVWCDGFESRDWQERSCKYLGIRLTDNFILHESLSENAYGEYAIKFAQKCRARKLWHSEFLLLRKVWNTVSQMRVSAHDTPLPKNNVWIFHFDGDGKRCLCSYKTGELIDCKDSTSGTLLLAVY